MGTGCESKLLESKENTYGMWIVAETTVIRERYGSEGGKTSSMS